MTMAQIELDAVKACDFLAIDKFYENNLSAIVKLDSPSLSLRTCSSKSSKSRINRCGDESDDETCPSDSDSGPGELELNAVRLKDQFLKYHQNDSSQPISSNQLLSKDGDHIFVNNNIAADKNVAAGTNIDTIAIQNSTDIQFGNKTFYNGPVFIKQFIKDENKRWISPRSGEEKVQIESGVENKGFDGETLRIIQKNIRCYGYQEKPLS
jgi:hypothetical protein